MENRRNIIVKSNSLVEASYKLSLFENRLMLCVIEKITSDTNRDDTMFSLNLHEIMQRYGIGRDAAKKGVNEANKKLFSKTLLVRHQPREGEDQIEEPIEIHWLQSKSRIDKDDNIHVRFSQDLMPYLIDCHKNWTAFHISNTVDLTSSYSIRLYEILTKWRNVGEKSISIAELRSMLLGQNSEKKYKQTRDFLKRVIEPALEQINERTDIKTRCLNEYGNEVFYTIDKLIRKKIISLKFKIDYTKHKNIKTTNNINGDKDNQLDFIDGQTGKIKSTSKSKNSKKEQIKSRISDLNDDAWCE